MRESDRTFFKPLWRRIAITLVCAAWTGFELFNGDQVWVMLSGGITLYAIWTFLIRFDAGEAE